MPSTPLERCDRNTLELALAKPRTSYQHVERYPTFVAKAAALLYGLAKSQACPDGNKRIALILVVAFVRLNGFDLHVNRGELSDLILQTAASPSREHDAMIDVLAAWFDERLQGPGEP